MKETEKNNFKNKILVLLKDCKARTLHDIAKETHAEPKLLSYLVEELDEGGLVEMTEITSKDSQLPKDYFVRILN